MNQCSLKNGIPCKTVKWSLQASPPWKAYDESVEAGYEAAIKALENGEIFPNATQRRRTGETLMAEPLVG